MRALSLWQPWASLIALGEKKIETRDWATKYRGPLLIHAAATKRGIHESRTSRVIWETLVCQCNVAADDLPLGAIVAVVDLVDVDDADTLLHRTSRRGTSNERAFGGYGPGRVGWLLDNVRALSHPVPSRGRQRLWIPSAELVDEALSYTQHPLPIPELMHG